MKNTPIHACAKPDLQEKIGELFLSFTSCTSIIVLGNTLNWCIKEMLSW
jgi:hypothetical protein